MHLVTLFPSGPHLQVLHSSLKNSVGVHEKFGLLYSVMETIRIVVDGKFLFLLKFPKQAILVHTGSPVAEKFTQWKLIRKFTRKKQLKTCAKAIIAIFSPWLSSLTFSERRIHRPLLPSTRRWTSSSCTKPAYAIHRTSASIAILQKFEERFWGLIENNPRNNVVFTCILTSFGVQTWWLVWTCSRASSVVAFVGNSVVVSSTDSTVVSCDTEKHPISVHAADFPSPLQTHVLQSSW